MAGELTTDALRGLVLTLAADRRVWEPRVRHSPTRRIFEQLLDDPAFEAWLICWMPGHDTGFHDHDVSAGAVTVVGGQVREERLLLGGGVSSAVYGPGEVFDFSSLDIHRVTHVGTAPAVTLHAYSPPLTRMGSYEEGEGGVLLRHARPAGEELRPVGAGRLAA